MRAEIHDLVLVDLRTGSQPLAVLAAVSKAGFGSTPGGTPRPDGSLGPFLADGGRLRVYVPVDQLAQLQATLAAFQVVWHDARAIPLERS
jgi:hypothetical protein